MQKGAPGSARVAVALALLGANLLCAQNAERVQRLRSDLQYLATELPRRHVNPFFHVSQAEFNSSVARLEAEIPDLTDAQVYTRFSAIVASLGDSHTSTTVSFQPLQASLYWWDDGIYLRSSVTAFRDASGARLIKIGNTPVEEAARRAMIIRAYDNEFWFRALAVELLIRPGLLNALGILDDPDGGPYTFEGRDGKEFVVDMRLAQPTSAIVSLPNYGAGFRPPLKQHASDIYWFEYRPQSRALVFQYNQCTDDPNRPFASFVADLFRALDENPVDTLVLDVSNNGGGNTEILRPFYSGVRQRLARLRQNPNFLLVVLVGRHTFSSGMFAALEMRTQFGAILAGEPTGGKPIAYGNVQNFTLPNSGMRVTYSTRYYGPNVFPGTPDLPSVEPEVLLPLRSTDYFARHEAWLMSVLARARDTQITRQGEIRLLNAASLRSEQVAAPGMIATAFGNFGEVGDPRVEVGDVRASVLYADHRQINFVVPREARLGEQRVRFLLPGRDALESLVQVIEAAPGIFHTDLTSSTREGIAFHSDGAMNSTENRVRKGDTVAVLVTGLGSADPAAYIAEAPAEVVGVERLEGYARVTIRLPETMAAGGSVPLFVTAAQSMSNPVTIWVE